MSSAPTPLVPGRAGRWVLATAVGLILVLPIAVSDDFWMTVLTNAGAFAVAAIGLALLTGQTGQVSLGHAAFLTIGGYTVAYFGAERGWPLPLWLLVSAVVGAVIGAAIGPLALRFRGDYLAIVTLALVFVTTHTARSWESFTGGFDGRSTNAAPLAIGPLDFGGMDLAGEELTREQGLFYLVWACVGLAALVVRNLVRSRPGRALRAVRDQEVAAAVLGVGVARYKIAAFAVSSALASVGGALYAVNLRFISAGDEISQLFLSIRFLAMLVVGGMGTIWGAVVGALLLGPLPDLVVEFAGILDFTLPLTSTPLVTLTAADGGLFTAAVFSEILFGLALIVFLLFRPDGVAGIVRRNGPARTSTQDPGPGS